jgi:hypothetical protein
VISAPVVPALSAYAYQEASSLLLAKEAAEALRESVVAQAQRSPAAVTKQTTGLTADGLPVHSFRSLLADLATLGRNTITTAITPDYPLTVVTRPTAIQHKAFDLLGVRCSQ